jgi:four helix bundle protein
MNSREVTMPHTLPTTGLAAHAKALEAAGLTLRFVARVPLPFKPIADQAIRVAASVPANLAEGHGRTGRDRMHHWRIAYGSAKEVDTHLRLLVHAAAVNAADAANALDLFDQVRAMTWRILNPSSE